MTHQFLNSMAGHYIVSVCDAYAIVHVTDEVPKSGKDLSRYSNKIESVDLRKCPYKRYLTKKVMSE